MKISHVATQGRVESRNGSIREEKRFKLACETMGGKESLALPRYAQSLRRCWDSGV